MIQHAMDAKGKEARRDAILLAARQLFLDTPDKLPSAAVIAEAAGLAKGTVYLYFDTKEEIFLALLQEARGQLLGQLHRAFRADDRGAEQQVAEFIDAYVDYVGGHPEMCRLDAMGYCVLERNLAPGVLLAHKLELTDALVSAGQVVEMALGLAAGQGMRLLIHSHALTLGLWQSLDHTDSCREMLGATSPLMRLDFRTELRAALTQYWRSARLDASR